VLVIVLFFVRKIHDEPLDSRPTLDRVGTALSALGLGLLVFGILKISQWGLFKPTGAMKIGGTEITPFGFSVCPFLIIGGLVVMGAFLRWEERVERHGRVPLLRADLLRVPQMRAGLSMVVSQYLILAGTFFVIPLYLQLVLGKNAFHTGLKLLPISVAMMIAAMLGPRLATRTSPRRIVQIGLLFLFVSILLLMATISPSLASVAFAISLAGFGAGIGLVISQLGNVVMSSVAVSRSSEAGGLQGTAQNLGQSLGTALIGAVLLTALTTGFQDRVQADPAVPQNVQQQVASGTEEGLNMISKSQAESIVKDAGLPPKQADALVKDYSDAQIGALKKALLAASMFALVGLWFARALPGEALGAPEAARPAETGPAPQAEPEPVPQV
jgi:Na+/melibiose symporter-like transporter